MDEARGDSLVGIAALLAGENDPATVRLADENNRLIAQFAEDLPTVNC